MALKFVKKKKPEKNNSVKSIAIVPSKLDDEQVQYIRKLQEEAAKNGRYIDYISFGCAYSKVENEPIVNEKPTVIKKNKKKKWIPESNSKSIKEAYAEYKGLY